MSAIVFVCLVFVCLPQSYVSYSLCVSYSLLCACACYSLCVRLCVLQSLCACHMLMSAICTNEVVTSYTVTILKVQILTN